MVSLYGPETKLGITDKLAFAMPIWQAFVTGVVFIAVGLLAFHAPEPRGVTIDMTGSASGAGAFSSALGHASPGGYTIKEVASAQSGLHDLHDGSAFGVISLGASSRLLYAGANGPTVTNTLTHELPAVGTQIGYPLVPIDALPLRTNDTAGLPLFYLVFGVILASYLFTITSKALDTGLPIRAHWLAAALVAALLGVSGSLFARFATHTIPSSSVAVVAILLALGSLGTSSATWLFLKSFKTYGAVLGSLVFVVLGSAAGGVVPGPFLPVWLAILRPVLPMGGALDGIRNEIYFGGGKVVLEMFVLSLWAVIPLILWRVIARARPAAQ